MEAALLHLASGLGYKLGAGGPAGGWRAPRHALARVSVLGCNGVKLVSVRQQHARSVRFARFAVMRFKMMRTVADATSP